MYLLDGFDFVKFGGGEPVRLHDIPAIGWNRTKARSSSMRLSEGESANL